MKLLLSAYACDPAHGGESGIGFHWGWQMAQRGQQVWCLTTTWGREAIDEYMAARPNDPATARLQFVYVTVPAFFEFLYQWQFGVYIHYMVWQFMALRVARKLDQQVNFDVVHHATYSSLKMGSWLWRLGKPLVYGPVGGAQKAPIAFRRYVPDWFRTETLRSAVTWVLTRFDPNLRQHLRHCSLVLASNDESADLARRLGARHVRVFLDTGLPEAFYGAKLPERHPGPVLKLLWVGRLYPNKALPLVLDALSRVAPRVRYHLTVLGDGPMAPRVPGWLAQYGVADHVTWRGSVPWSEVCVQMHSHDVFFFTSLRESFASQFMEAMATGLPIITVNHQGARTFIPATASIKVPVDNPDETVEALARAVEYLYDHPQERLAMGRAGYEFALRQTWPDRIERLFDLMREAGIPNVPAPRTIGAAPEPAPVPELVEQ
ncbi:glycosyltransferase family 4 protein [Hymenobacter busanensis]|uniref:Glycosyltransferase family 4 protein n=1 Tax=Hymenobacter busanensis TaxID=2607656 RepID=A0A7L4ZZS6_9BACT|nr:glycosyltransferase family 4 protein [Hymenobacter busanensis]KAA9339258.1 glycosyltransferase family 4 protein [Hymenobacter busanensis]QHJ06980.1 glycosyltransferase [Hymenobacter busanensis]